MGDMKILIRTFVSPPEVDDTPMGRNKISYSRTEFHVADLEMDVLDRCSFPALVCCGFEGFVVPSGSCVYVFGGDRPDDLISDLLSGHPEHFFMGGACLDKQSSLLGSELSWHQVPSPGSSPLIGYAAIAGKIYSFGDDRSDLHIGVFDPAIGYWTTFSSTSPFDYPTYKINEKVLADPTNNRFLVLVMFHGLSKPKSSLYAFYPDAKDGTPWKCLASDFFQWSDNIALVDNVLYFYAWKLYTSSSVEAYNLESGIWLDVNWSSPFENSVPEPHGRKAFDAFFSLGPKTLCFARWFLSTPFVKVIFVKVRVDRTGSTICITPISFHTFGLPDNPEVSSFIPI